MKEHLPIREGYLTIARVFIKLKHTPIIKSHSNLLRSHLHHSQEQQCKNQIKISFHNLSV